MTVTEVKGYSLKGSHRDLPRRQVPVSFLPKLKIEVVVPSNEVERR